MYYIYGFMMSESLVIFYHNFYYQMIVEGFTIIIKNPFSPWLVTFVGPKNTEITIYDLFIQYFHFKDRIFHIYLCPI